MNSTRFPPVLAARCGLVPRFFSYPRPLWAHCGRGQASPGDGVGLHEPHRAPDVVAGSHQGEGKVGSGLSDGADHLAAHGLDGGKHVLDPRAHAGNARVARFLPLGQWPVGLGLALDLRPVAFGLGNYSAPHPPHEAAAQPPERPR